MTDTVEAVLERAIAAIHEYGHTKETVQDPRTRAICAYGALNMAIVGNAGFTGHGGKDWSLRNATLSRIQHLREFVDSFRSRLGDDPGQFRNPMKAPLAQWNDHPDTTADDVIHMFKYAIEAERTAEAKLP